MKYVSRLLFLLVALMAMTNCGRRNGTPITETDELVKQNSMYYWKTTFDIDSTDVAFRLDNDTYYCSELVYDIYKKQLGIELCKPKKIDDYLILCADKLPKIKKEMQRRGIKKEQYAVAPVDVFRSDKLKRVR